MEKTVLIGIITHEQGLEKSMDYLDELAFLTMTAGGTVTKTFTQKLNNPNPKTFIGEGSIVMHKVILNSGASVNKNCIIKIILTRGDNSFGYKIPINIKHNLYFIRNKKSAPIINKNMVRLGISTYKTFDNSNLARIKHLNRIDQCLIAEDLCKRKDLNDLVVFSISSSKP